MGVNLYVSLPMIHFEDVFDEMAWYGAKGIDGILTQFHLSHWSVYGMNYYMMAKAAWGADKKLEIKEMFNRLFGARATLAKKLFDELKKLTLSAGDCHTPYPYSLFSRTRLEQYEQIRITADQLAKKSLGNSLCGDYVVWSEYLYRFKELFDRYHHQGVTCQEINNFQAWIRQQQTSHRLFVTEKTDMLLNAWQQCIKDGREWLHFNIDWEDEYIKTRNNIMKLPKEQNESIHSN
jgi:hypothetical protein